MTDVLDDSVSWEQRRELRKKKRQELLAEADRLVKKTDESSASSRFSQDQNDEDDEFERERQRRRREREERRRKDREELESQLKDEAEMKAERERRREERRRQREMEKESYQPAVESYSSKTVVSKTVETPEDHNLEEETTVETEHEETVEEHVAENGHAEAEEDVQNDISEPEPEPEPEPEAEIEEKDTYETSITAASVTSSTRERFSDEDHEADEVQQKQNDMKLKSEQSDEKHQEDVGDDYNPEDSKARLKELEERKRLREKKRLEEEEKEREEAAKREAQHQDQLRIEREEREKRRAEAEVKRQEYRKQLSQAEDKEAAPLSPKNLTSPLSSKVEQLNKHITESSKSKTHDAPKVGSLDSRLEKYTKQASKQEVKKAVDTPGKVAQDVSNRRNKWERGEVQSAEKSLTKKETITTAGGISSRKNLWESGKLGSSAGKSTREATEVKGADFSSRRNQWLKVSQKENVTKKSESPVGMKTGVMSRLNRWEKGEVGTAATPDKSKAKGNLPVSGVVDRRAKWENINSETSKTPVQKSSVRVTANISNRRNKFETKEAEQPAEATNRVNKEEYEDRSIDEAEDAQGYDDEEISTHSSDNLGDYEKDSD